MPFAAAEDGAVKHRGQRGLTLVELIIAMAVTSIVMVGLVGIVFAVNQVSMAWGQRTYLSQAAPLLPNTLQADAHRYVPCSSADGSSSLQLCLPNGQPAVTYAASGSCPCDLTRTNELTGSRTVVVHGLLAEPSFTTNCAPAGGVSAGSISIRLRYQGDAGLQAPVVVYFRAPAGGCGR
jgi:prepilin-type N-terminal cleavage/methylation domain-containing protein